MRKYLLMALLCAGMFTSCKDEDPMPTPLSAPAGEVYQATVSSLTFRWDSVKDATQYGYELKDADGVVVAGDVTAGTVATITGLKDNSTYTLEVWAYAAYDTMHGKSGITTLTGSTPAIVQLSVPVPSATVDGAVEVSWEAVSNASGYSYSCTSENGTNLSGTISETSVKFNALITGIYSFTVKSISDKEEFSDSEYSSPISFEIEKKESWRTDGTFDDGAGNKWPVTMIAWNNGTYTLKNWYNVEGFDLEFSVNDDTTINILNAYEPNLPNIWVKTGIEGDDGLIRLYTAMTSNGAYSGFEGTRSDGGLVWFYSYKTEYYAEFTWNGGGNKLIDEIVGTYAQNGTGTDYTYVYGYGVEFKATNDVTITKTGDKTIKMTGFFTDGTELTATLDENARTLTFDISVWLTDCYFSAAGHVDSPVVATVNGDGTISFTDWSAMAEYSGVYYDYVSGTSTTLTKK